MAGNRGLPSDTGFGPMRDSLGLRFTFAGSAYLNRYANLLGRLDLTPSRVLALSYIHQHPGCDQRALAANLAMNEASAMQTVNRLNLAGFAERRPGRDKRTKAVYLTDAGERAFDEALRIERELSELIFGHMGEAELGEFMRRIDDIRARASALMTPPPPDQS